MKGTKSNLRAGVGRLGERIVTAVQEGNSSAGQQRTDRRGFIGIRRVSQVLKHIQGSLESPEGQDEVSTTTRALEKFRFGRKAFLLGTGVVATAMGGLAFVWKEDPTFIHDIFLRFEFNDVWDEVQAFMNPPSETELLTKETYNANGRIALSTEQLSKLSIYQFGDSMNLKDGIRINSKGPDQDGSSGHRLAENLTAAATKLGSDIAITNKNYAQPGASSVGLVGYESPEGNVQLGATSIADMADDTAGEIPPIQRLRDDPGIPIVILSMNGDDWRNAVDQALYYVKNDAEFAQFLDHPSKDALTDGVAEKIKSVLATYKADRERFQVNYEKALRILAQVNDERKHAGKDPMILIAPLPINLEYADNAPYAPLDAKRGTRGQISMDEYPNARTAAFRVTSSIYQLTKPALEDFARRSGITVVSKPLLDLARDKKLFADDGHFNEEGEKTVGDLLSQLFSVGNQEAGDTVSVEFGKNGEPIITQMPTDHRRSMSDV